MFAIFRSGTAVSLAGSTDGSGAAGIVGGRSNSSRCALIGSTAASNRTPGRAGSEGGL